MGRRRIGAQGVDGRAGRQRTEPVHRSAEGVDGPPEPTGGGADRAGGLVAHHGRTAAPNAFERAERHGQRPVALEPDDLARDGAAAMLHHDVQAPAEPHDSDRPGDLDQQALDRHDATERLQGLDAGECGLGRSEIQRGRNAGPVRHLRVSQRFIYLPP